MTAQRPPRRPVVGSLEGMSQAQNINRRNHQRTVPMKVLCFGLSRTGTSSLRQALLDLSYSDVYHFASILNENPPDADLWLEALEFKKKNQSYGRRNWDALLGHCEAVTDSPAVWFWEDLLETYPEAKVIVTVRDSPAQWVDSHRNTLVRYMKAVISPAPSVWRSFCSLFAPAPGNVNELSKVIATDYEMYRFLRKDTHEGTREAERFYERHLEEVKKRVPREKLLVMNVKDGWKPLCDFLGKEAPPWDFPRANSGDEFLQNMAAVNEFMGKTIRWNMAKALMSVATAIVAGLAWWATQKQP